MGWTFQEGPEAGGEAAEILTVPFSTYKTGVFEYDPDSGLYLVEEYGEPYVDGNTGEQVAVKNVLVLYTHHLGAGGRERPALLLSGGRPASGSGRGPQLHQHRQDRHGGDLGGKKPGGGRMSKDFT